MKRMFYSLAHLVSVFALAVAMINANTRCLFTYHQPKIPDAAKALRKF